MPMPLHARVTLPARQSDDLLRNRTSIDGRVKRFKTCWSEGSPERSEGEKVAISWHYD